MECEECGNDEKLYLHSKCHIDVPTWAILDQKKSELEIICAECGELIVKFKVLQVIK